MLVDFVCQCQCDLISCSLVLREISCSLMHGAVIDGFFVSGLLQYCRFRMVWEQFKYYLLPGIYISSMHTCLPSTLYLEWFGPI